jgi:hypothetical protein
MKPKGLLPHAQVPATCPYPEPDHSSLYLPTHLKINFNIIIPSVSLDVEGSCECIE